MDVQKNISMGWLTVNRACENRCSWCYAQGAGFDPASSMSREKAESLVNFMADLGIKTVSLIGGEPNLYRDLFYVLDLISQNGMGIMITSNGRRFSDIRFSRKMAKYKFQNISISLKGIDREQYMRQTNADGFDDVCQGIKNLAAEGLSPSLFFTFGRTALGHIDKTLEFLSSLEANSIAMNFANPVIIDGKARDMDAPDPVQIADAYTRIIRKIPSIDKDMFLAPSIPLCLLDPDIKAIAIKRKMLTGTCYARVGSGLIFSPEGEVIPCHQFTDYALGSYGADFTDIGSFKAFWYGDKCLNFRRMMNNYPSADCIECADWVNCFGGCPIKWFYFHPQRYIKKGVTA